MLLENTANKIGISTEKLTYLWSVSSRSIAALLVFSIFFLEKNEIALLAQIYTIPLSVLVTSTYYAGQIDTVRATQVLYRRIKINLIIAFSLFVSSLLFQDTILYYILFYLIWAQTNYQEFFYSRNKKTIEVTSKISLLSDSLLVIAIISLYLSENFHYLIEVVCALKLGEIFYLKKYLKGDSDISEQQVSSSSFFSVRIVQSCGLAIASSLAADLLLISLIIRCRTVFGQLIPFLISSDNQVIKKLLGGFIWISLSVYCVYILSGNYSIPLILLFIFAMAVQFLIDISLQRQIHIWISSCTEWWVTSFLILISVIVGLVAQKYIFFDFAYFLCLGICVLLLCYVPRKLDRRI